MPTKDEKEALKHPGVQRVFRAATGRGAPPVTLTKAQVALIIDALVAYAPQQEEAELAARVLLRMFEVHYDHLAEEKAR